MNEKYKLSEHARYDSFPLRFGIIPASFVGLRDVILDEASTSNQKPKEIRLGNYHVIAVCYDLDSGQSICRGRFVLTKKSGHNLHQTIVTAFSENGNYAERAVSDLIRKLREENEIDTDFILKNLHQEYVNGEISNELSLFKHLVILGIKKETDNFQEIIKSANLERDVALEKARILEENFESKQKADIAIEKNRDDYKGEKIDVSPVCTLSKVHVGNRKKFNGEIVGCTFLHFEDDVPPRKMDHIFDKTGKITKYAETLIGKKVYTTVWKPEVFKPLEWFRNIFTAE